MMFLVIIGIGVLVYYSMNNNKVSQPSAAPATRPLELLEMRYAKGEIDEETFLRMKSTLLS